MAVHVRGLDWLNFFLADVQTGVGPFLAIYLAQNHWDPEHVGIALTAGGIAGIVTQTPAGWLVDRFRAKRGLIAVGVAGLCAGSLMIALRPSVVSVMTAQVLIGGMSSIFNPAIAAISLGLVGRQLFDRRQGRNQSWNSAGNLAAAVAMGLIGTYVGPRWIFYLVVGFAIPALLSLLPIRPDEIDYQAARGADDGADAAKVGSKRLLKNHPLLIFLACAVLFHFANAAMLPLLGEMLSEGDAKRAPLLMMLCVATTQAVITLLAAPAGRLAASWGRKPVLLVGFGVLPIRGVLYTLTRGTYPLVSIQVLDGVGAGIFNVVAVLVIADLTRGTGRFNVTQGAIFTAVGIGAALSQTAAGAIVERFGYHAGFLFLAAVAAVAFGILLVFMPETRPPGGSPVRAVQWLRRACTTTRQQAARRRGCPRGTIRERSADVMAKIGVIGAGGVGSAALLSLVVRGSAREIVVLNRDRKRASAVATDLRYGAALSPRVDVRDGDYSDLAGASLVMIAAGVNEKAGGATDRKDATGRLRLLDMNVGIYRDILSQLLRVAPDAVILVLTDPPDPLADFVRRFGFEHVLSSGTFLDSLRFRYHLARRLDVDPASVTADVLGEHGTSEVFIWSSARVAGVPVPDALQQTNRTRPELQRGGAELRASIEQEVRYANITIIEGNQASQFGIGMVAARIAEMVLRDERAVIPIGSYNPRYDVTLSLPSVIGRQGVVQILEPDISEEERQALQRSAETLRDAVARLKTQAM